MYLVDGPWTGSHSWTDSPEQWTVPTFGKRIESSELLLAEILERLFSSTKKISIVSTR